MARCFSVGLGAVPRTTVRALPIWLAGICTLATIAGASAGGSPKSWDTALPSLVKRCISSVVVVTAQTDSSTSQGSGVILDMSSGKVLTCDHVIRGARSVSVKTSAGWVSNPVGLLWSSTTYDLALLEVSSVELYLLSEVNKIENNIDLRSAPIGDWSKLMPGERVLSISSPAGLENTVSEGIVSAVRRVRDLPEAYRLQLAQLGIGGDVTLLQFSAPSYFGSSGGPVFNRRGEVVGVVALRHTADNVYFAIPARKAIAGLANETATPFGGVTPDHARQEAQPTSDIRGPGILDPVAKRVRVAIPSGTSPEVLLEEGLLVDTGSVHVSVAATGAEMPAVPRSPKAGQCHLLRLAQ